MPRVREFNIIIGDLSTGRLNCITDVPGVAVGHATIREEARLHTGVTAIVPSVLPAPAAVFAGNGYGKLIGVTQIHELGELETPILLTSTLNAFRVADAMVSWVLAQPGNEHTRSLNPVVGETNDGWLSDIRSRPITHQHVFSALESASAGPVEEGCVGAGAGTVALGFKGGIGSSSRMVLASGDRLDAETCPYTIGVLVQSNYGGTLTVQGKQIAAPAKVSSDDGSCMIIVATDAPLDARQLQRIARRAVFAMARTGANYSHGSGDYAIAVSTGVGHRLADALLSPLFVATMDAVEEALLNSLFMAETTHGIDGHVAVAITSDLI